MEKLKSNSKANLNDIKKSQSVTFNPSPSECLCHRPKTNILCIVCGNVMYGRVRHDCHIHPTVRFLYDIDKCTVCYSHAHMLSEILNPS